MLPPPWRASLVTYASPPDVGHAVYDHVCEMKLEALAPLHSPPGRLCTNTTASTKPSSSPELGMPSGPSLSYFPKSTVASLASSTSLMSSPVNEQPSLVPL